MAYTEYYVSADATGGNDGTSETTPWTLAEAFAGAVAGDRVNIKTGNYSLSTTTLTSSGTSLSRIYYRGYSTIIGDLDDQWLNSDGTVDTTNFPSITLTGQLTVLAYTILHNLNITADLNLVAVRSGAQDYVSVISCRVENTNSDGSAGAFDTDNNGLLVGSTFICSGTTHGVVAAGDIYTIAVACYFKGTVVPFFKWMDRLLLAVYFRVVISVLKSF